VLDLGVGTCLLGGVFKCLLPARLACLLPRMPSWRRIWLLSVPLRAGFTRELWEVLGCLASAATATSTMLKEGRRREGQRTVLYRKREWRRENMT
jgi:hypothetical protein